MEKPDLTRRQMLSGIAVTGGAGALTGRGTAALLSDEETFTNNSVTGSASTAGAIELDVTDESLTDSDGIRYSITVPDTGNNNPSYIWVQPTNCPDDAATEIDIELRVECENDGNVVIATGTLEDVVNDLRTNEGEPLRCSSGENARCFEPGETVDLVLEVTSSNVDTEINITFEFYAEQCRYNTGTSTPFDSLSSCDSTGDVSGQTISFIACCSESGDPDPEVTNINSRDEDGPTSADWDTENTDVDYVVAKSGQKFAVYDYRSETTTSGTVTTGEDTNADFYGEVSGTVEDGFEEATGSVGTSTNNNANNASSVPGELAADIVGNGEFPDDGTVAKLEEDSGTFKEE